MSALKAKPMVRTRPAEDEHAACERAVRLHKYEEAQARARGAVIREALRILERNTNEAMQEARSVLQRADRLGGEP